MWKDELWHNFSFGWTILLRRDVNVATWWSFLYLLYIVNFSLKSVFFFGWWGTSNRVVKVFMCHIRWHPTVGELQNPPLFPTAWPVTQYLLSQFISVRTLLTTLFDDFCWLLRCHVTKPWGSVCGLVILISPENHHHNGDPPVPYSRGMLWSINERMYVRVNARTFFCVQFL